MIRLISCGAEPERVHYRFVRDASGTRPAITAKHGTATITREDWVAMSNARIECDTRREYGIVTEALGTDRITCAEAQ